MKRWLASGLVAAALLLAACAGPTPTRAPTPTAEPGTPTASPSPTAAPAAVRTITPQDAKARMDADASIVLVDVRTQAEFDERHIPGAILLPIDAIEAKAEDVLKDKEATYFIYCRSGNRSATASDLLVKMGYRNIHDLGGIIDWPYETTGG